MEVFESEVCFAVFEITDHNMNSVQVELTRLKTTSANIPILAVVSKDTANIVKFAMNSGIHDVMLLPTSKAFFMKSVQDKMEPYYEKFKSPESNTNNISSEFVAIEGLEGTPIFESLTFEIKRAQRGQYSVTFIMAHMTGITQDELKHLFNNSKTFLRDTDNVIVYDERTFIGVFPFVSKDNVIIIEQKFRDAFEAEFTNPLTNRIFMFSATYPDEETEISSILKRLESGISNSMLIDSIKTPLNELSKTEIESYKQKIRQYKRFF